MLARQGFVITEEDLCKSRKDEQYDEELAVMAETSAYFLVAYKVCISLPRPLLIGEY